MADLSRRGFLSLGLGALLLVAPYVPARKRLRYPSPDSYPSPLLFPGG